VLSEKAGSDCVAFEALNFGLRGVEYSGGDWKEGDSCEEENNF